MTTPDHDTVVVITNPRSAWVALGACLLVVFMQMLDTTIVNIALPDLTVGLGASSGDQVLVLAVYTLAFACSLLTAARAGARWGRRRVFLVALVAFTVASVLCGLAANPLSLIIFRAVQGIAAAFASAQTLALIASMFPARHHPAVFGWYGAVAGVAAMLGPVIGGVLIAADIFGWGWRSIFFVNVPIGVIAAIVGMRFIPVDAGTRGIPFDRLGAALSTAGLFALLYPLAVGREADWPPSLLALLLAAPLVLAAFVFHERRLATRGGSPLLQMSLLGVRSFGVGVSLSFLFFGVFAAFFFTISLSAQFGLGYSALKTGLLTVPFAVGAVAGSLSSPVIVRRLGSTTLTVAALILAVALCWLAGVLHPDTAALDLVSVVPALVLGGAGTGLFVAPLQATILSGADSTTIGSASGAVPTIQQIGASIGLAAITIFFFGQVATEARSTVTPVTEQLGTQLQSTAVPELFRPAITEGFARCATEQLTSAHPERRAPGCGTTTSDATSAGSAQGVVAAAEGPLRDAARLLAARTFMGAMQTTLWVLAALTALVSALALLLRSPPPRR